MHGLCTLISFDRSGNSLTAGLAPAKDRALFEISKRGIRFDVCGELAVMEVDTALHITTPVQFREVNTAFDVEDTLGFA